MSSKFGIKNYYQVKMAQFLDENTIQEVLSGSLVSFQTVKDDLVLSKLDRASLLSFIFFMLEETKVIHINEMATLPIIRIASAQGEIEEKEEILIESINSLEVALEQIEMMATAFDQEIITGSLTTAAKKVATEVSNEDLFFFFQEYDKEVIIKLIHKAREANANGGNETDETIKEKMIISKLKTKINESNISLGTMIKLQNPENYENVHQLQALIDHN